MNILEKVLVAYIALACGASMWCCIGIWYIVTSDVECDALCAPEHGDRVNSVVSPWHVECRCYRKVTP